MAEPKKLPSGSWRIRICYLDEKGKQVRKSFTAETKQEARHMADVFMTERKHNKKIENKTIKQFADYYIENRSNVLSPTTITGYKSILKNFPKDLLETRIGLLTHEDYQAAINQYSVGRSPKTVKSAHQFLNKVLTDNHIYISENTILPRKTKTDIEIPTTEEVVQFLKDIEGTRTEIFVAFSVFLGLRRSETFGLKWKDIDFDKKIVKINKARVINEDNVFVEKVTKTYAGNRELTLPDVLFNMLPKKGKANDYIIEGSPTAIYSLYNRQRKNFNFPYHFHSLRHYFASVMLMAGVPNKYAMERMGHSTDGMLKNVYQHTFKSKQQEYDVVLNDIFNKTDNKENAAPDNKEE